MLSIPWGGLTFPRKPAMYVVTIGGFVPFSLYNVKINVVYVRTYVSKQVYTVCENIEYKTFVCVALVRCS